MAVCFLPKQAVLLFALSHSAFHALLQTEPRPKSAEKEVSKNKNNLPPREEIKKKKKKEGECPKGENDFAEQKAGGKQLSGQMRVVFEELFVRGSGAWRHHDVSAGCSFPPLEPALFWGHRAAVGFYFQTSVLQPCEYISCY